MTLIFNTLRILQDIVGIFNSVENNFAEMEMEKQETECKIILFPILKFIINAIVKITEQQKNNRMSSDRTCREPLFLRRLIRCNIDTNGISMEFS